MKLIVKQVFVDKENPLIQYRPGDVLEWDDQDRIDAAVKAGLVDVPEVAKAKKTTKAKQR